MRETLSNVAVAKEAVVRLLTAKPTLEAMLTVWFVPSGIQFAGPDFEAFIYTTNKKRKPDT